MIISHKYKFIFVKTKKVAGSSFEMSLRPYLGEDDIVTPMVEYDEQYALRHGISGPKNLSPYYDQLIKKGRGVLSEHAWAYEIRGLIGNNEWENYYKFTIERDPREKVVSSYYHLRNRANRKARFIRGMIDYVKFKRDPKCEVSQSIAKICDLKTWIKYEYLTAYSQNYFMYTQDDELLVDKVYSYKNLALLQTDISERMNTDIALPNLKSSDGRTAEAMKRYDSELQAILKNKIYAKEMALLND